MCVHHLHFFICFIELAILFIIKIFNLLREPSQVGEAKPQPKVGLKQLLKVYLINSLSGVDFEITVSLALVNGSHH